MLMKACSSLPFISLAFLDSKYVSGIPSGTAKPVTLSTESHSDRLSGRLYPEPGHVGLGVHAVGFVSESLNPPCLAACMSSSRPWMFPNAKIGSRVTCWKPERGGPV